MVRPAKSGGLDPYTYGAGAVAGAGAGGDAPAATV